jgi:hypothetical protein
MAALEMLQWLKAYFDQTFTGGEYDGQSRRAQVGIRDPGDSSKAPKRPLNQNNTPRRQPATTPARTVQVAPATTAKLKKEPIPITGKTPARPQVIQVQKIKQELEDVKKANQNLLDERNFYYGKLQKVEAMCQIRHDDFANEVLAVLYETDEAHGFISPDELDI